jgi:hypothetical protein
MNALNGQSQILSVRAKPILQNQASDDSRPVHEPTERIDIGTDIPKPKSPGTLKHTSKRLTQPDSVLAGKVNPNTVLGLAKSLIPTKVTEAAVAVKDVITGAQRESSFEYTQEHTHEEQATQAFSRAKERLFNPNSWGDLGHKILGADFKLVCGSSGQSVQREPKIGDYLKIKLPDPGPPVWVTIEHLEDTTDSAKVVVRPSADPGRKTPETIIHLFGEETTNVFEVKRDGLSVVSSVTGKNETANFTGNLLQDAFAGARLAGAWVGLKKPQWKAFVQNIVEGEPPSRKFSLQGSLTALAAAVGLQQPRINSDL